MISCGLPICFLRSEKDVVSIERVVLIPSVAARFGDLVAVVRVKRHAGVEYLVTRQSDRTAGERDPTRRASADGSIKGVARNFRLTSLISRRRIVGNPALALCCRDPAALRVGNADGTWSAALRRARIHADAAACLVVAACAGQHIVAALARVA